MPPTRRYDVAMKKLLLGIGAVLAVLAIIMIVRANTVFDDVQLASAQGIPQVALDESGAVERLAGAIRFRTISHDDRSNFDAEAFLAFHDYLQQSFPLVHAKADKTIISGYSLDLFPIKKEIWEKILWQPNTKRRCEIEPTGANCLNRRKWRHRLLKMQTRSGGGRIGKGEGEKGRTRGFFCAVIKGPISITFY